MSSVDARYRILLQAWRGELEKGSVLEVGCGSHGVARYLKNYVTGLENHPVRPAVKNLEIAEGCVTAIPWPDGAFDYVVCTDVLGRLRAADRSRAVAEIIRVAKTGCFILGPHGDIALSLDGKLAARLARGGAELPRRLQAQIENGLPMLSETLMAVLAAGFVPSIRKNEGVIEHFSSAFSDMDEPQLAQLRLITQMKGALSASGSAETDVPYSIVIAVDKNRPAQNVADPFIFDVRPVAMETAAEINSAESRLTIFSTHHRPTGLMNAFRLIRAFDVSGQMAGNEMSLKEPEGFFEERNERCSELSAFHYIWRKRLFGDLVGFCHYRRFLYPFPEDVSGAEIRTRAEQAAALLPRIEDRRQIAALLDCHDLLTARPLELEGTRQDEQYAMAHYADDYYAMLECLLESHPYLGPALNESMNSTALYAANMILCRKELFEIFCRVWFDILGCCAARLDPSGRNAYQSRDIAFLSERVFDTLVRHLQRLGYRVGELPKIFVEH